MEQQPDKGSKRPKKQRSQRERVLHILWIVLTVAAAVIVAAFVIWNLAVKPPQVPAPSPQPSAPVESGGEEVATWKPPLPTTGRKKDFFTFLLVGRDTGGGGNTDTIMVVAYDVPNQQVSVMSIPRDTMINASWDLKKINSVYNVYGGGEKGIAAVRKEVGELIGFEPDFQMVVEWEAVGKIVDAIGTVWFDVPQDMNYDDPGQELSIHLKEGYQEMDGDKAMQLLRWRKNNKLVNGRVVTYGGYPEGDIGRIRTQQDFLKAVLEQCLSQIKDLGTISRLAGVLLDNVGTDLPINNIAWFAQQAVFGGLSMENVTFATLPGNYAARAWSRTYPNDSPQSYVTPYAKELLQVVNEYFNPYKEDLTAAHLDIMSVNSDGTISSSTGHLADQKHNPMWQAHQAALNAPPEPTQSAGPEPTGTVPPEESPAESVPPEETGAAEPSQSPEPSQSAGPSQTPEPDPAVTTPPPEVPVEPPTQSGPPEGIPIG